MVEIPKPSTYTPLFRRFGSEKDRELREVRHLYEWVAQQDAAFESQSKALNDVFCPSGVPWALIDSFSHLIAYLIEDCPGFVPTPPPMFARMSMQEFVEYRNLLYAKQHFHQNRTALVAQMQEAFGRICGGLVELLPEVDDPSPFTVPLACCLPDPGDVIHGLTQVLGHYAKYGLFCTITEQIYRNLCEVSGRDPSGQGSKPWRFAHESPLSPVELANTYLKGSPFHDLFLTPVPLKLTHQDRFNHWHVLAGSGQGKTVLIENLIRYDLASSDPPSIVLIDPHSDLVRKLVRSDLGIEDRLILIDPRDTQFPVALNPFAVNRERFAHYDDATKEQVTAGVLQTFGFLWNGLTNLTLTGKQDVFFRYVTRLMLTLPDVEGRNATILDMLKLMGDPAPYARAIEALPDIPREFFMRDFMSKTFDGTKEQVRYRLQAIIESPTMARLFTAPETKIDLFSEMNRGAVILVDTAKDFLKDDSAVFGKLIISLVLQAILERAAIPEADRKPTFLMVDEGGSFFSQNIDDLLTEARKYKCGILAAHQYLDQAKPSLRASFAANTGIKFASGLSAQDAAVMARDMRTSADFILSQPKLQFAAHIRGVTPSAVSIPITPMDRPPQLSDDAYFQLIARNRERV
ncbi:type IV secretory system conjugative DNA transfer family protein, partial [Novosphingobium naphthalenivorans]|uniref:type IV secretory system conjugative DNA transfer family protein n=1 Tax=Novosphingobium naphthalenivorans TaxID=273168 RepID=UPI0008351AF4